MGSLWGDDFVVEPTPKVVKKIIEKIKKPKEPKVVTTRTIKSKTISIDDKLSMIREEVYKTLGRYEDSTQLITTREGLHSYIDTAISNGVIAIDTETNNSLQPVGCKLMGACIYTPGLSNVYIPVNHINDNTGELLDNQLTEKDIYEEFSRLNDNVKCITHNGKFDYEVLKYTTGWKMPIYWDTMIGARILDENERASLKLQYISKIDPTVEKYSIDHLFEGVEYAVVDPKLFALYAATDAYMTYKLYLYQVKEFEKPDNARIYNLFKNIEMPDVEVFAEMELAGVELSLPYAERLKIKYGKMLDDLQKKIDIEFEKYNKQIEEWRLTPEANYHPPKASGEGVDKSLSEKLQTPINTSSSLQMAIFFYDVLKMPVVDKKKPRGTGEDILTQFKLPICDLILEYRGLSKLISTYIDALPNAVNPVDGRVHCQYNQIGAGTGRVSSDNPNMQNIPSNNRELRMLFKAAEGNVMVGADFSQQEPRLLAMMSHDEKMIEAYRQKKDLYATVACSVFNNTYWDNMESHEDGTPNPEGKKRRSFCKSILLGLMYGRGAPAIAEQTGSTVEEAQRIINNFYDSFPKVKKWIQKTEDDAKVTGYVEDFWGRRRRLPDLLLPKYTIRTKEKQSVGINFNPILGSKGIVKKEEDPRVVKYTNLVNKCKGRAEVNQVKVDADKEGISIIDNSAFIAQAERQCVNARIQGGAASMTKIAMRKIYDDKELRDLGFKLLITVHDELIGECPAENADKAGDRLSYIMSNCIKEYTDMPFKCDSEQEHCWYFNTYEHDIEEEIYELLQKMSWEDVCNKMKEEHTECTPEELQELLDLYQKNIA